MNFDDAMQSLQARPRPRLGPFFAARVANVARSHDSRRPPRLLWIYWGAVSFFAGSLLLATPLVAPLAILAGILAAARE